MERTESGEVALGRHVPASDGVVVHYHEIGLKGRNRGYFERSLVRNLGQAFEGCDDGVRVEVIQGRLFVRTSRAPSKALLQRVGETFGVATFAPAVEVANSLEAMSEAALGLLAGRHIRTFAVAARRATKDLPYTSRDINVELGSRIQEAFGLDVDLDAPDATAHVEVVGRRAFLYLDKRTGPGGLPVGVSGKIVALLSGGIDSPVATMRMLKRGSRAVLCHFHSAPFTDRSSVRKATELARLIADRQGATTLYLVPLGEAQREVVTVAPPDLRVVLYRRLMVRIAGSIASAEGAKALVLGDSLGQVASQTLENMICTDDASPMPLLRPLVGSDKQEIVEEAKRIGTYETSILPYEDCCSLFVPRSPATKADPRACRAAEADLDVEALVSRCVAEATIERVGRRPCREAA